MLVYTGYISSPFHKKVINFKNTKIKTGYTRLLRTWHIFYDVGFSMKQENSTYYKHIRATQWVIMLLCQKLTSLNLPFKNKCTQLHCGKYDCQRRDYII